MKKFTIFLTIICGGALTSNAWALGMACSDQSCSTGDTTTPMVRVLNCKTKTVSCWGGSTNNKIESCTTCNSGYTRTRKTVQLVSPCANTGTYYDCVKQGGGDIGGGDDCDGTCDNCLDSVTSPATGYEYVIDATCNTSTCTCSKKFSYRCAKGWWGTPPQLQMIGNYTGCTQCSGGGTTSGSGAKSITSCYVTGLTGSDSTGSWSCTSNAYYQN